MSHPVRTCVGCRSLKSAAAMLRVTEGASGADFVFGGPSRGRGVWICSDACKQRALTSGALDRSFGKRGRKAR